MSTGRGRRLSGGRVREGPRERGGGERRDQHAEEQDDTSALMRLPRFNLLLLISARIGSSFLYHLSASFPTCPDADDPLALDATPFSPAVGTAYNSAAARHIWVLRSHVAATQARGRIGSRVNLYGLWSGSFKVHGSERPNRLRRNSAETRRSCAGRLRGSTHRAHGAGPAHHCSPSACCSRREATPDSASFADGLACSRSSTVAACSSFVTT